MRVREKKGSGLVDYVVPTAIVGLVLGLGIYGFTSEKYLEKFISASGKMTKGTKKGELVIGNNEIPGYLGGTTSNPKIACDMTHYCTIDFGSYVLKGIPEDYGSFIESSGTSGGTEKLADLIEQMAQTLEQQGNIEGAKDFRDLSNYVHFMSDIQRTVENKFKNCGGEYSCISTIGTSTNVSTDSDFQAVFDKYENTFNDSVNNDILNSYRSIGDIGTLIKTVNPVNEGLGALINTNGEVAKNLYNKIKGESYPEGMQGVVDEIMRNVNATAITLHESYQNSGQVTGGGCAWDYTDNLTGEPLHVTIEAFRSPSYDNVIDPRLHYETKAGARVVCVTGRNIDNPSMCK